MWSDIKLSSVQRVEDHNLPGIVNILKKLYNTPGYGRYLGTIINAIVSSKRFTFVLSYHFILELLQKDPYIPASCKKITREEYSDFIQNIEETHYFRTIKDLSIESDPENHALLMTIIHPVLLPYLEEHFGREAIRDQEQSMLRYTKGVLAFENENSDSSSDSSSERNEGKRRVLTSQEMLFEARKKAQSMGLLEEHFSTENLVGETVSEEGEMIEQIQSIEDKWQQERLRYQSLLEQVREEEQVRLREDLDFNTNGASAVQDKVSTAITSASEQMTSQVTLEAVQAGIRAQKQKKLLEEIECELLALKDDYKKLELIEEEQKRKKEERMSRRGPDIQLT